MPGAQGVVVPEGSTVATASGEGARTRAGCFDRGTREEDDPGTWEAHVCPRGTPGVTGIRRDHSPTRRVSAEARAAGRRRPRAAPRRRSLRLRVGRKQGTTGAEAEADVGVGGPNRSKDLGERVAPDPGEQREPVSRRASGGNHGRCTVGG